MKNRHAVLITLLVIFLPIAAVFASNYNLIAGTPKMEIVERPAMKLLYIDHLGGYQKASTFIVDIYQMSNRENIACEDLIGIYYDTVVVPVEKRRSRYACVVKEFPETIPEGYKTMTIPAQTYAYTLRDEQGFLVNSLYGMHMTKFSQENGYATTGYFIEVYTPTRFKRGHAAMLQALRKPDYNPPAGNEPTPPTKAD